MDIKRARQIISSPNEVTVHYHGVSVWLKNCNDSNQSVSIYATTDPDEVMIVPVEELEEK